MCTASQVQNLRTKTLSQHINKYTVVNLTSPCTANKMQLVHTLQFIIVAIWLSYLLLFLQLLLSIQYGHIPLYKFLLLPMISNLPTHRVSIVLHSLDIAPLHDISGSVVQLQGLTTEQVQFYLTNNSRVLGKHLMVQLE